MRRTWLLLRCLSSFMRAGEAEYYRKGLGSASPGTQAMPLRVPLRRLRNL